MGPRAARGQAGAAGSGGQAAAAGGGRRRQLREGGGAPDTREAGAEAPSVRPQRHKYDETRLTPRGAKCASLRHRHAASVGFRRLAPRSRIPSVLQSAHHGGSVASTAIRSQNLKFTFGGPRSPEDPVIF